MAQEQHIEVDTSGAPEGNESDSLYGSDFGSDTTSLVSAAKNHIFENGRRFHGYKEGTYVMPNDEKEQDRMDLGHHMHLLALEGGLYTAPIKDKNPQRILDLGTGTGIWCIDIGDEFPAAEVVGVDLSPIQPKLVPPNVTFVVDDFEADWTWQENYFDYIHMRSIAGHVKDWPRLVRQAYRALEPGGYIELQDLTDFFLCDDNSVPENCTLREWVRAGSEAMTGIFGRHWLELDSLFQDLLQEVGAIDITVKNIKIPVGPWAKEKKLKELGLYTRLMNYDGVESFVLAPFTRALGWDVPRVGRFVENAKKDLMNSNYHSHHRFYCVFGRKPEKGDI